MSTRILLPIVSFHIDVTNITNFSISYLLQDRKDLANILLLQGELQGRNHYLKQANLFAHDVQEDSLMHDREHFLEEILEDGMDL